jgi:hypothetical protein
VTGKDWEGLTYYIKKGKLEPDEYFLKVCSYVSTFHYNIPNGNQQFVPLNCHVFTLVDSREDNSKGF